MALTELGAGFGAQVPARDEIVFRSDVDAIVERAMRSAEQRLEQLCKAMMPKETPVPIVNVPPANVTVAAPNVTIQAEAPEAPDEINVTMPGMAELRTEVAGLRADVQTLCRVLASPVIRDVQRNSQGTIDRITEKRVG